MDFNYWTFILGLALLGAIVFFLLDISSFRGQVRKGRWGFLIFFLFGNILSLNALVKEDREIMQQDSEPGEMEHSLFSSTQWRHFYGLWKGLNWVEPREGDYYPFTLTQEEFDSFLRDIQLAESNFEELQKDGLISEMESDILLQICRARASYMFIDYSFVTRMMPGYIDQRRLESLASLEKHIDMLIELRKKDVISTEEFQLSMDILIDEIPKIYVLSKYLRGDILFYSSNKDAPTMDDVLNELDKYILDFQNTPIEEGDQEGRDVELEHIQKLRDQLNETYQEYLMVKPRLDEILLQLEG